MPAQGSDEPLDVRLELGRPFVVVEMVELLGQFVPEAECHFRHLHKKDIIKVGESFDCER